MVRKSLKENGVGKSEVFRLRGLENTRVESLSDGVFAIAIGLLLISSDFPKTFIISGFAYMLYFIVMPVYTIRMN